MSTPRPSALPKLPLTPPPPPPPLPLPPPGTTYHICHICLLSPSPTSSHPSFIPPNSHCETCEHPGCGACGVYITPISRSSDEEVDVRLTTKRTITVNPDDGVNSEDGDDEEEGSEYEYEKSEEIPETDDEDEDEDEDEDKSSVDRCFGNEEMVDVEGEQGAIEDEYEEFGDLILGEEVLVDSLEALGELEESDGGEVADDEGAGGEDEDDRRRRV